MTPLRSHGPPLPPASNTRREAPARGNSPVKVRERGFAHDICLERDASRCPSPCSRDRCTLSCRRLACIPSLFRGRRSGGQGSVHGVSNEYDLHPACPAGKAMVFKTQVQSYSVGGNRSHELKSPVERDFRQRSSRGRERIKHRSLRVPVNHCPTSRSR